MFQSAPALRGECYGNWVVDVNPRPGQSFNRHPPLGANATACASARDRRGKRASFNRHPPLGANATAPFRSMSPALCSGFNRHPPLGANATLPPDGRKSLLRLGFQSAPALRGECYLTSTAFWLQARGRLKASFNRHPPLGANATSKLDGFLQWMDVSIGTRP